MAREFLDSGLYIEFNGDGLLLTSFQNNSGEKNEIFLNVEAIANLVSYVDRLDGKTTIVERIKELIKKLIS